MPLLDTNILSELRRRDKTHHKVAAWADTVDPGTLYLSLITILEIEIGAARIARRDASQGAMLRNWIDHSVLPTFASRILPITVEIVQRCARLHVPESKPERDAMIAATALVHGMTVVTRNVADFFGTGVEIYNPFSD